MALNIDWPRLIQWAYALGILVGGWIVAVLVSAIVRWLLKRLNLDKRVAGWSEQPKGAKPMPLEGWIASGVFYVLMIVVLALFFYVLAPTLATGPLTNLFTLVLTTYLPQLVNAALLVLAAFIIATVLRAVIARVLAAVKFDERVSGTVSGKGAPPAPSISRAISEAVYWLVFLLFLPAILAVLNLQGLLQPVENLVNGLVQYLPNILGAAILLFVGWLLARILQRIVTNLLAAAGADRLSEQVGLAKILGTQKLSGLIGLVVYIFVFIPILISALQALKIEAISTPATNMFNTMLSALPGLFGGVLVLLIAYVVGNVIAGLVTNLLAGVGFDTLPARLGLGKGAAKGQRTPSQIVGYVVLAAIMLFAIIQGAQLMGLTAFADIATQFLGFAGKAVVGLIIFFIGLWVANLAAEAVQSSGTPQAGVLAFLARAAILVLAGFVALGQMGVAENIIAIAFGAVLGAIAVAAALAFGLGGREIAGQILADWMKSLKKR
jgi:hypothetical protein